MAIEKEKILPNGTVGNYWRVYHVGIDIGIDPNNLKVTFTLGLYLNKDTSDSGAPPMVKNKIYAFYFTRTQILSGNILALGYTAILAKANTMVGPLFESIDAEEVPFDSDLSEGVTVL